jgi:hypothetical protein
VSNTVLRKRAAQALAAILVLSILLTATIALAATYSIRAGKGGEIKIAKGVTFVVPSGALKEDTVISADMKWTKDHICFYFGPDGTTFDPPAELRISWYTIGKMDMADAILYGENGEKIMPQVKNWQGAWPIPHFSMYYFRRR